MCDNDQPRTPPDDPRPPTEIPNWALTPEPPQQLGLPLTPLPHLLHSSPALDSVIPPTISTPERVCPMELTDGTEELERRARAADRDATLHDLIDLTHQEQESGKSLLSPQQLNDLAFNAELMMTGTPIEPNRGPYSEPDCEEYEDHAYPAPPEPGYARRGQMAHELEAAIPEYVKHLYEDLDEHPERYDLTTRVLISHAYAVIHTYGAEVRVTAKALESDNARITATEQTTLCYNLRYSLRAGHQMFVFASQFVDLAIAQIEQAHPTYRRALVEEAQDFFDGNVQLDSVSLARWRKFRFRHSLA